MFSMCLITTRLLEKKFKCLNSIRLFVCSIHHYKVSIIVVGVHDSKLCEWMWWPPRHQLHAWQNARFFVLKARPQRLRFEKRPPWLMTILFICLPAILTITRLNCFLVALQNYKLQQWQLGKGFVIKCKPQKEPGINEEFLRANSILSCSSTTIPPPLPAFFPFLFILFMNINPVFRGLWCKCQHKMA